MSEAEHGQQHYSGRSAVLVGLDCPAAGDSRQRGHNRKRHGHADEHRHSATNERAVRPGEHEGQHRQNAGADDSEYAAKIGQHEQDHCRKLPMSGGGDLEGHRDAIDAVAKARRLRAVLEHMTKVATATAAVDSRPHHTERGISRRADGLIQRRPEAWPASA